MYFMDGGMDLLSRGRKLRSLGKERLLSCLKIIWKFILGRHLVHTLRIISTGVMMMMMMMMVMITTV
jgi:hypothetical protein